MYSGRPVNNKHFAVNLSFLADSLETSHSDVIVSVLILNSKIRVLCNIQTNPFKNKKFEAKIISWKTLLI